MQGEPVLIGGVILVVVLSITSHEAAHGLVADLLGDLTAREHGRLTLNPIPHIDVFMTLLLPMLLILSGSHFIFGGAKPVPVNVSRLHAPRRDWALVGVAGPMTNLFIAVLLAAGLSMGIRAGLWGPVSVGTQVLVVGMFVNILLAIFNLLPIPPLDGSRVVQYFLTGDALRIYQSLERFGLLLVLFLVFFMPPVNTLLTAAITSTLGTVTALFGLSDVVASVLGRAWLGG
ncbi:MAG: site-2 protease family protein [Candidatus Binatia bacterium]